MASPFEHPDLPAPPRRARLVPLVALLLVFQSAAVASLAALLWICDIALPFNCPCPWPGGHVTLKVLGCIGVLMPLMVIGTWRATGTSMGAAVALLAGLVLPVVLIAEGGLRMEAWLLSLQCDAAHREECRWAVTLYVRAGDKERAAEQSMRACQAGISSACERHGF